MKRTLSRMLHSLCHTETWIFFIASLLLVAFAAGEVRAHVFVSVSSESFLLRALLLLIVCLLFYLGGVLYVQRTQKREVLRRLFLFFFLMYLYLLLNVTLLERGLGRNALILTEGELAREYYIQYYLNLRPFYSIWQVYIQGFLNGYVNAYYTALNLLGNICVFMPFALFLPLFFKAQRRWYCFLPTVLLCVILTEAAQFLFMVGSCDIDDLILNGGGAMLLYCILKLPPMQHLIKSALLQPR